MASARPRIWCARIISLIVFAASSSAPFAGQVVPDSAQQLAAAPRIVLADLGAVQSRWNPQGTLIVTDYRFHTVETLRGTFAAEFTLTQGGGTVGEETHELSDMPVFRSGGRYLLVMNSADNAVFSPIRYGPAGVIEVERVSGRLMAAGADETTLADFRRLVQRTAVIDDANLLPRSNQALPASEYRREPAARVPAPAGKPLQAESLPGPDDSVANMSLAGPANSVFAQPESVFAPKYTWQRRPAPPVNFNPLPHAWVWHPADQNMMAEWNRYGDVFRVFTTPTGTWAWANDRYDLAGFPSDADMVAQFGSGWGATTLAICFSRWFGTGNIVESDIAVNPAFAWTLDDEFGTRSSSSAWSFRQSMQHELGHSWGLQHPFEFSNVFWPSTMNYGPKWARDPTLHSDDTGGIRNAYPGIAIHDGAVQLYRTADSASSNHAAYTSVSTSAASYTHGSVLSFTGAVWLQNLGTSNLVDPIVDVYLSEYRMSWLNYVFLGRNTYTTTVAPFPSSLALLNLGGFFLPSSVPTGVYFPAIYLAGSGATDQAGGNNSAWAIEGATTTISNVTVDLLPTTTVQYAATGNIGPLGQWTFRMPVLAGKTYTVSTCGSASFDSVIRFYTSAGMLYSDDDCGVQSNIRWYADQDQTVNITVSGFSQAAQGSFQLQYAVDPDTVFFHSFGG